MHARNDRLRNVLDRVHHARARLEEMMREFGRRTRHVGEVVTGAEHRTVRGDDHAIGIGRRDRLQRVDDLEHRVERQGVALLRAVEREGGDGTGTREADVVVAHVRSLSRLRAGDTRQPPDRLCALRGSNPRPTD